MDGACNKRGKPQRRAFQDRMLYAWKGRMALRDEAELLDTYARRCSPPLPNDEVVKIARSASSYAANRVSVGA